VAHLELQQSESHLPLQSPSPTLQVCTPWDFGKSKKQVHWL